MGLDTSHGCWTGAYSAFSRWRDQLCVAAGWHMETHKDGWFTYQSPREVDWSAITEANLLGDWEKAPGDPLTILIAHSDCGGYIRHQHTGPLADRLTELLPKMLEAGDGGGHIGQYAEKTAAFIEGLREAERNGEDVEFG
jgi:hypothetical protein